ncbi:MAG TPA: response regulator [Rhodopila sp.]|uniref:response regulator n=1 Tax=Rhodopila sp. TaxID=2480087 RepID=UPI002C92BB80|nr:response regulator [Rhodopila sp.]HVY14574.1 response regulator [Rhodopila sp.]
MTQPDPAIPPRVLVVEDTALVAMLIETVIEDMGWTLVGPAARLQDALAVARDEAIDVAIIDVDLNGEPSWDVAHILRDRGVPFLFTTGYSDASMIPAGLRTSPMMGKPFQVRDLERWLRDAVPAHA